MRTLIVSLFALAGAFALSSCISVKTQKTEVPRVTTTTTERTTPVHARNTTVETKTTRTY
ncbi:MAG: hypothetical protein ACOYM3_03475 [Terrimicrobiaceae bacterium]